MPRARGITINKTTTPPGVAVGALPCVCTQDSQCEQVFGAGYSCENEKCVSSVGGSSPSLSSLAQFWNFFKSLLTAKTGKAITGNAVSDSEIAMEKERDFFEKIINLIKKVF